MNQAERDRLDALKRAKKKLITQQQAAAEIGVTERHLRRLLRKLRQKGDRTVIHELRGRRSNRKLSAELEQRAVTILSDPVYRGFGPTLASEYLHQLHQITVSKETLRQWMTKAGLWRAGHRRVVEVHQWRPRRSRWGELVQWDTSDHDWLEGRGESVYLIAMIDDATSRLFARFVRHDSSEENRSLLRAYLERFGRPLAFYTDKAGMFQVAVKTKREQQREGRDRRQMPPTQIERALRELNIVWIPAHSPQAKGRIERQFLTAQDRLVKGLRVAGACTLDEANAYLENEYLAWWNQTLVVKPADPADAHRPLGKEHDLAAILSHVEPRQVTNDYTVRYEGKLYQIDRRDIQVGMRKGWVRVEQRLDGSIAVQFQGRYLRVRRCAPPLALPKPPALPTRSPGKPRRKSEWMKNFSIRSNPYAPTTEMPRDPS
ncbi:MAG TPA: ISNCY family transposase [Candidatus Methylomirabilis sp.]|nr:ISNCY family transposase [Candidatus Methylomirabilis sp.]